MKHFPHRTPGCYYERPQTCCWICLVRMVLALVGLSWQLWRSTVAELASGFIGALLIGLALVGLMTMLRPLMP